MNSKFWAAARGAHRAIRCKSSLVPITIGTHCGLSTPILAACSLYHLDSSFEFRVSGLQFITSNINTSARININTSKK